MAEFCLECWKRINKSEDSSKKYILSKDLDLCEGCGEFKNVIVEERRFHYYPFECFIFLFKIIYYLVSFLVRLIMLPYLVFKYYRNRR